MNAGLPRAGDAPGTRRQSKLPSGRHGLQRSFVVTNQRGRILTAVAQAAAALGYAEMSVESIIERAGVSRRTFYDHFKNKEDAFLAAYDAAIRQQVHHIKLAYLRKNTVRERLRAGIAAYLDLLASEPEAARMCIVEVLAAGPRALARRTEAMRMFTALIEDNIHELLPGCPVAALAAETIVGGIHEVVYSRILQGRTGELPALAASLFTAILVLGAAPHSAR
jgi:AcrR family transcriptional regulator